MTPEELAQVIRERSEWFTTADDLRITCECSKPRPVIARAYQSADGSDFLYVYSSRVLYGGDDRSSDREKARFADQAFIVPKAAGPTWSPIMTNCRRCNSGFLFTPLINDIHVRKLPPPTYVTLAH